MHLKRRFFGTFHLSSAVRIATGCGECGQHSNDVLPCSVNRMGSNPFTLRYHNFGSRNRVL